MDRFELAVGSEPAVRGFVIRPSSPEFDLCAFFMKTATSAELNARAYRIRFFMCVLCVLILCALFCVVRPYSMLSVVPFVICVRPHTSHADFNTITAKHTREHI